MGAKKKPRDKLTVADAGIEADRVGEEGSRVICGDFTDPPSKAAGTIIEDVDADTAVEQIVEWLDERKLLA